MILEPGDWRGRGSFRRTDESLASAFRARLQVAEDPVESAAGENHIVEAELDIDGDEKRVVMVLLLADGFGTYAVRTQGGGFDLSGTAKIESEPHLALLWNDDLHVACSLFAVSDSVGFRGFAKAKHGMWTWELALRPAHLRAQAKTPLPKAVGNVVSLMSRRKRR